MVSSVAVLGAGGPTGLECVKRLLSATDFSVRAVVRDPAKYASTFPQDNRLSVIPGDVTQPDSLSKALQGCDAAIYAASGKGYWSAHAVDNLGVANVAAAAKGAGVGHVVMVSSQLVSPHQRWHPMRILLNNIRWGLMDAKLAGEKALRASGVAYTIVRPGGLSKAQGGVAVTTSQGDTGKAAGSPIGREVVAAVCVAALTHPQASQGVTVEVSGSKETLEPARFSEHVAGLFQGLKKDPELSAK